MFQPLRGGVTPSQPFFSRYPLPPDLRPHRLIWIPAFAGMTTIKQDQFATSLSDIRSLTANLGHLGLTDLRCLISDIYPFLPEAMAPCGRPPGRTHRFSSAQSV